MRRALRSARRLPASGLVALALALALATPAAAPAADASPGSASVGSGSHSPLAFTLPRIDGTPQPLSAYRGRVLLLVNVASKCGYTPQYEGLEALYARYRERGFTVLGFPANDFKGQEPGTNAEIADFCRSTYGVRFPMFAKLHVRGPDQHPLCAMLTGLPALVGGPVAWNFQKYLVDRQGEVVARFAPATEPGAPELVAAIERLLDAPAP